MLFFGSVYKVLFYMHTCYPCLLCTYMYIVCTTILFFSLYALCRESYFVLKTTIEPGLCLGCTCKWANKKPFHKLPLSSMRGIDICASAMFCHFYEFTFELQLHDCEETMTFMTVKQTSPTAIHLMFTFWLCTFHKKYIVAARQWNNCNYYAFVDILLLFYYLFKKL